jgi:hypothetical protein
MPDRTGGIITATVTDGRESWAACQEPDCDWIGTKYKVGDKQAVQEATEHSGTHF